ncbi:MAG: DUF2520 domain-containing protein [bacterium]|nr:DUF2520 domain-containing protein [bacterium]
MNFNIIGAGRLGKNIALNLITAQVAQLDSVCNRTIKSARLAINEIGQGSPVSCIEELPPTDVTWITSNDDAIESVVKQLTQSPNLKPNSFIIHCSGVLNSQLLLPLKAKGCFIASFHPLKAFKKGNLHSLIFQHVDCVIEGDEAVCAWLESNFKNLGANLMTINPNNKALYHSAAVIASNYLITLAACSEQLLLQAGIPEQHIRTMITHLMHSNLQNLQTTPTVGNALTGPLMRGDIKTLELHINAITDPLVANLYKTAGLATLPMTHLDINTIEQIKTLLKVSRETSGE